MRRVRDPLLVVVTTVLVMGVGAPASLAHPGTDAPHADLPGTDGEAPISIDDQRELARNIQAHIDANGTRISALAEQLNGAQYRLEQIDAEIAGLQTRIDEADAEIERRRRDVNDRAVSAYKRAGTGGALDVFDLSDPVERNAHAKYTGAVAAADAQVVAELHAAQRELGKHRRDQEQARAAAQAERDELARRSAEIRQANAEQAALLAGVDTEIRALMDEERAAREAELAELDPGAPPPPPPSGGGGPVAGPPAITPTPPDPPPAVPPPPLTSRAQIAVDFAYAQLGKPYCWGGNGWGRYQPEWGINCPPGTYDCSGLTMRAWGAAGVSMPHYSGAQYAMFPKVPLHALRPGDLVFYGPGGSQHVGIYIGGGQMIEAPFTGSHVRIGSVYRPGGGPVGAVRPG